MLSHLALVARIGAGALLGGVIGYERDLHGRPIGLRTHMLVAMTAATFMVVSAQFVYSQHYGKEDLVAVDSSRIAASVVTGIGFLAGGSILRTGATIQGITTAAGLWLVTAIGLCAGAGMYVEGVAVTAMGMTALTVLRRFEDKNDDLVRRSISIVLSQEGATITQIEAVLKELGGTVSNLDYDRRLDQKKRISATFDVQVPAATEIGAMVERIEALPGVMRIQVRRPA